VKARCAPAERELAEATQTDTRTSRHASVLQDAPAAEPGLQSLIPSGETVPNCGFPARG